MENLRRLKSKIDEENYPYFTDEYLQGRISDLKDFENEVDTLAKELCIVKSGIEGIKLGDIEIPSPKQHFLTLASRYRKSLTGTVERADER